ncbi:MAG: hypothetical protein LPK92_12840, partial [Actinomycetes bacterium]|nr:hypothetical protein [Actinomycetes bacterium]
MRTPIASLILAAALAGAACSSEENQAAKARIFSPEDPPRVLQAAAEPLDSARLGQDGDLVNRVFAISGQEAAARLGPHVQKAKVTFQWSRAGKEVALSEDRMIALGNGGDFHVRIENDQRQGMEWVKVDGTSYARSRYAQFRERRRDRGSSEHVVASAYSTLSTFNDWVHGAMRFTPAGTVRVDGRQAVKYTVSLGEPNEPKPAHPLPEIIWPKNGPDLDTQLRQRALEQGKTANVTGTLVVDEKTAVPLLADLQATVVVPADEGE